MNIKRFAGRVSVVLLIVAAMSPFARTDEMSELTKMTFQHRVQLPGLVLPPGSYYFTRIDDGNDSDMNLIRVFSSGKKQIDIILQTASVEREHPRGRTVLTFAERPNGRPPVLVDWFYPGSLEGHQFLYSARREGQIENSEKITVLADDRGGVAIQGASNGARHQRP
jgi:hypothetical protein